MKNRCVSLAKDIYAATPRVTVNPYVVAKIAVAALFVIIAVIPNASYAQRVGSDGSFFTDIKAARIGDLLTVIVYENTEASNESQLKTEEKSDASTRSGGGVGPLNFIPLFAADNQSDNTYDGKGTNSRRGSIRARMTVEVIAERNNGDLVIQGSRVIEINSEKETMTLSGIVRRADISPDNTIDSYNIANAKIEYTGKGPAADGSKPGLITRILNWVL